MSEPIPAATILLLRDAPDGLEVLMVERHQSIAFGSGALVFPGGKLAAEDSDEAWSAHVDAAVEAKERALRVAAVREAFEESGLLLARTRASGGTSLATHEEAASLAPLRDAVNKGEASFLHAVEAADLMLALDTLTPFAHWITPERLPKRFDTHFYIAAAPPAQHAICDGGEAVEACWITPHAALQAEMERRRRVMFPTRLNLELLGRSETVREALATAKERPVVTVLPRVEMEGDIPLLTIPENAGYSVTRVPLDPARD